MGTIAEKRIHDEYHLALRKPELVLQGRKREREIYVNLFFSTNHNH